MDCERIRTLAATGAELPPHLVRHVDGCAECRTWLEEEQKLVARLERVLGESLAIEPSPSFKAAVRRRIAQQCRSTGAVWWLWPALAAGLVVIVWGATSHRQTGPTLAEVPTATASRAPMPPATATAAPSASADGPRHAADATPARGRERVGPAPQSIAPSIRSPRRLGGRSNEPEVLVPAAEARALEAYYRETLRGRTPSVQPAAAELAIAALEIAPLADSVEARPVPDGNGRGD